MRFLLLMLLASLPVSCSAQWLGGNGIELATVEVDYTAVSDFVVNDMLIDFAGQLGGQQLLVELSQGSIYQHPAGGDTAPNETFLNFLPLLEYDSFVTLGGLTQQTSDPVWVVGGATELGGAGSMQLDEAGANIAWAPSVGVEIPSGNDYPVARITLSRDAIGTFSYFGSVTGGIPYQVTTPIQNGIFGFSPPHGTLSGLNATPRNEVDGVSVDGVVINDIALDFDGALGVQTVVVELTAGSVYQDATNGDTPPDDLVLDVSPQSIVDTFVALGSDKRDENPEFILDGCPPGNESASFCQSWNADFLNPIDSQDFFVGRISLSDDATGRFSYTGASPSGNLLSVEGWIENGTIYLVPEPATCWLFAVAGLGWRRRQPR